MARMTGAGTAATRPGSTVLGQALLYHHSAPVRAGPLRPGQLGVLVTIQRSTLSNRGSPGACQLFASISPAPKKAAVPPRQGTATAASLAHCCRHKRRICSSAQTKAGFHCVASLLLLTPHHRPMLPGRQNGEGSDSAALALGKGLAVPRRQAGLLLPPVSFRLCTKTWS